MRDLRWLAVGWLLATLLPAQEPSVPSFGSVGVPALGRGADGRREWQSAGGRSGATGSDIGKGGGRCTPGPPLEAREYTQPDVLGRPDGARARMCFYRQPGVGAVDTLEFYSSGHFVLTTQRGAGGFGMGGAVNGTLRGTYGFFEAGVRMRTGYAGISVSQRGRGAGSDRGLATAGEGRLEREVVLPNCQKIRVTEETKRVNLPVGGGHPRFLVIDGERWERQSIDCPDWQGWKRD